MIVIIVLKIAKFNDGCIILHHRDQRNIILTPQKHSEIFILSKNAIFKELILLIHFSSFFTEFEYKTNFPEIKALFYVFFMILRCGVQSFSQNCNRHLEISIWFCPPRPDIILTFRRKLDVARERMQAVNRQPGYRLWGSKSKLQFICIFHCRSNL